MEYKNSQILAAVVSEWARPAISQIAAGNLMRLPMLQSLQATIGGMGLVSGSYSLQADMEPMIQPVVNALVTPMLTKYFGNIPEESIPQMAHDVVNSLRYKGPLSVLEGLVTFEEEDLDELADLLQKNLPVESNQGYQVKH
ncbi:MAG TPA: hypothetical protein DDW28_10795 [Prevotella sp.]|nr:hypothetical protein [uncultured Prevotella sp.]HBF06529.1 hypothetical protein [Candidatus Segatella violae]